jgi:hypothetical protein
MMEIDLIAIPTIYVCAIVFGFMLNSCSNKREVERLTDQVDELEWELSVAIHKLELANEKLELINAKVSPDESS